MKKIFLIFFLIPFSGFSDPWSVSEKSPVIQETDPEIFQEILSKQRSSFWDNRFEHGYYFYQKIVSPGDGARCGMYPTCADYGYQAMQRHGMIIGSWMAADRLIRDHGHNEGHYPLIEKFGRRRFFDPLNENDFWITK
ncbi:MAG: membrane protein insertion efficiency factor YidD [Deltaproteobacteria bacterium]